MKTQEGYADHRRDGNTRLCTATAAASMRENFGSDGQPGSYGDIDFTDCIFIVGHNPAATQTVLWSRVLDRLDGAHPPKMIVVDSRLSETAKKATVHLEPRIGTNMALLNGIQYLLFENVLGQRRLCRQTCRWSGGASRHGATLSTKGCSRNHWRAR